MCIRDSSWAALGLSWALLGWLLGTSWTFLDVSWLVWGASWVHFGSQNRLGRRFYQVLGRAGLGFGTLRGHVLPCLLLHLALRYAMLLLMQLPRFCIYQRFSFFPSGAAVCAQHMELVTSTQSQSDPYLFWTSLAPHVGSFFVLGASLGLS